MDTWVTKINASSLNAFHRATPDRQSSPTPTRLFQNLDPSRHAIRPTVERRMSNLLQRWHRDPRHYAKMSVRTCP